MRFFRWYMSDSMFSTRWLQWYLVIKKTIKDKTLIFYQAAKVDGLSSLLYPCSICHFLALIIRLGDLFWKTSTFSIVLHVLISQHSASYSKTLRTLLPKNPDFGVGADVRWLLNRLKHSKYLETLLILVLTSPLQSPSFDILLLKYGNKQRSVKSQHV